MPVEIKMYYYNKFPGHVALGLRDWDQGSDYYIAFGGEIPWEIRSLQDIFRPWGTFETDFAEDKEMYGCEPLVMSLDTDKSYTDLIEIIEEKKHSVKYEHYSIFTNNCAHFVWDVLTSLGYLQSTKRNRFALLPYTIIAETIQAKLRSLDNDINRLANEHALTLSDTNAAELDQLICEKFSLLRMGAIITHSKDRFLANLLQQRTPIFNLEQQLNNYSAQLPPQRKAQTLFIILVAILEDKATELKKLGHSNSANVVSLLAWNLDNAAKQLACGRLNTDEFKTQCLNAIEQARPTLAQHHGFSQILNYFNWILRYINKQSPNVAGYWCQTKSEKWLNRIQKVIESEYNNETTIRHVAQR